MQARTVGRALVVLAFVCGAVGSVLAKFILDSGATPPSFLLVRLVSAVAVLGLLTRGDMWRVPVHRRAQFLGTGVLFGCQSLIFFSAVALSPVALVVVTVASYPVHVLLLDAIAAKVMPKPARLVAMGTALVGLWFAAGSPDANVDLGLGLALVSSVGYAVYLRVSASVLAPRQRRTDSCDLAVPPRVATLWVLIGALGLVTVANVITGQGLPPVTAAALSVVHGLVSTALPLVAIYAALTRIRAGDVATLGPLEPIVASGLAVLVLGESLNTSQLLGIVVVVGAVAHMSGVIRVGRAGRSARPRVGLPRLPFVVPRVDRPERRHRHVAVTSQAEVARLWGQAQS